MFSLKVAYTRMMLHPERTKRFLKYFDVLGKEQRINNRHCDFLLKNLKKMNKQPFWNIEENV